jgi:glucokinase
VLSSEGGHIGLFAWNKELYDIMVYIRQKKNMPEHMSLSAEHVFCGSGLPYVFAYFSEKNGETHDLTELVSGEKVYELAKAGNEAAKKTMRLFIEIFATTLQHLAASLCPENGIILSGGILRSIHDYFFEDLKKPDSIFFEVFYNNGALHNFLKTIPIYYCVKDDLGLFGCMVGFRLFRVINRMDF